MKDNKSANKRIAKNTLFLYVQSLCMLFVGLYSSRVALQALGVSDYGVYSAVAGVIATFSLLTGSMTTATQRFITYSLGTGDNKKTKAIFNTCITIHLLLGILVIILMELIGIWFLNNKMIIPEGRLTAANIVLQISIINAFVNVICVPYDSVIIAHEKMKAFAFIGVFEGMLKLLLIISLLYVGRDKLVLYAFFLLMVMLIKRVIYTIYTRKNFEEAKYIRYRLDRNVSKELISFIGWNMIGSSAAVLRNNGVDVLLNVFFGVLLNAAKGVCNQVQGAVMQFVNVFQTAVNPQLIKSVAEKDYNRNHSLLIQGTRFSFFLLLIISVPLVVCTDELLSLWLVEVPDYSAIFIRLTLACLWVESMSTYLSTNIMATGDIKNFQIIVGGMKLMVLPLSYVFLKFFDANATICLVISIVLDSLCFCIRLYFNAKRVDLSILFFIKRVCLNCSLSLLVSVSICLVFRYLVCSSLFVLFPMSLFITLFVIWIIGLSSDDKRLCQEMIGTKLKKKW